MRRSIGLVLYNLAGLILYNPRGLVLYKEVQVVTVLTYR